MECGLCAAGQSEEAHALVGGSCADGRDVKWRCALIWMNRVAMAGTLLSDRDWSMSIERQAQESLYCSESWLNLLTSLYGYSLIPLTARDANGRVTGFLPLCSISSPLRGRRLVALPFSDQCPLLATDSASADSLVNDAILLAQRQQARYLELRTGASEALSRRSDLRQSDLYVGWLTPLSGDSAEPWSMLRKTVQQKVGKARRLGVQVRVATRREEMARFYQLHLRTRTKNMGCPPNQPASFSCCGMHLQRLAPSSYYWPSLKGGSSPARYCWRLAPR